MDSVIKNTYFFRGISPVFKKFGVQVWFFFVTPFFFLSFVMIYRSEWYFNFLDMGRDLFAFNVTFVSLIIMAVLVVSRLIFYDLRRSIRLTWGWYVLWMLGELLLASVFSAVYVYMMNGHQPQFYSVLARCVGLVYGVMVFPYVIICLSVSIYGFIRSEERGSKSESLVRFADYSGKIKLILAPSSILFVKADENYVNVNYVEASKAKEYTLRTSMKKMDDLLPKHSMIRCHRSYFINPSKVSSLRKEKDGLIFVEFDEIPGVEIPVSKRYYESLAELL